MLSITSQNKKGFCRKCFNSSAMFSRMKPCDGDSPSSDLKDDALSNNALERKGAGNGSGKG